MTNPLDALFAQTPVWEWTGERLSARNEAAARFFPGGAPPGLVACARRPLADGEGPMVWLTPSTRQFWQLERYPPYLVMRARVRADLSEKLRLCAELGAAWQIHRDDRAWEHFSSIVGAPPPDLKVFSVADLARELLPRLVGQLAKKPASTLKWDEADLVTGWVEADLNQLVEALAVLYRNAQEAPRGLIQLRLHVGHQLELSVHHLHHAGEVATESEPARMGEPFITTKSGHFGLGLFQARRIVFLHGGELIWKLNRYGSDFSIVLPIESVTSGPG